MGVKLSVLEAEKREEQQAKEAQKKAIEKMIRYGIADKSKLDWFCTLKVKKVKFL